MPTVIRMSRTGRTNRPFFRVGVWDERTRRDGPPVEYLGWYDPKVQDKSQQFKVDAERVAHWFSVGAKVSDTVRSFLRRAKIAVPARRTARAVRAKDAARRGRAKARRAVSKKA